MPPSAHPVLSDGSRARAVLALVYTAVAVVLLHRYGSVPAVLARIPMGWRGAHIQIHVRILWAALHAVCLAVVPLALARACRLRAGELGLGSGATWRYLWIVAAVAAVGFGGVLQVCRSAVFLGAYPMYRPERADPVGALLWLAVLGVYLFCIELYFRGFLLAMLAPALGDSALLIALVPYVATHRFLPELLGAIPVGLLLGVLRQRAASLWPGYLAHYLVALELELVARWQHGFL